MRKPLPIRCEDLAREPAGTDRADLAEHLASCPDCASRHGRETAFARLWDETRPSEPNEATWDGVWARVSDRLDRPAAPPTLAFWPRHARTALVVAQAAALLAAAVVWGAHRRPEAGPGTPALVVEARPSSPSLIDIEVGAVVMIHLDGGQVRVVEMGRGEGGVENFASSAGLIDENFVLLNGAEAMFGTQETVVEMHHDAHFSPPPG